MKKLSLILLVALTAYSSVLFASEDYSTKFVNNTGITLIFVVYNPGTTCHEKINGSKYNRYSDTPTHFVINGFGSTYVTENTDSNAFFKNCTNKDKVITYYIYDLNEYYYAFNGFKHYKEQDLNFINREEAASLAGYFGNIQIKHHKNKKGHKGWHSYAIIESIPEIKIIAGCRSPYDDCSTPNLSKYGQLGYVTVYRASDLSNFSQ